MLKLAIEIIIDFFVFIGDLFLSFAVLTLSVVGSFYVAGTMYTCLMRLGTI